MTAPTPAGLFVYQFEALSRNRLGYDQGLVSIEADPFFAKNGLLYQPEADLARMSEGRVHHVNDLLVTSCLE